MNSQPQPVSTHPRRFVAVEGSINLRDFGGYVTTDGATVRDGLLFRCGSMADIPEHAFDDFAALDIGVICDLRSHEEAENYPTPAAEPFSCRVHIPIWPGSSTQFQAAMNDKKRGPTTEEFVQFMEDVTREIARDHVEAYKQLLLELVRTDRGFLLHCSAGKDRTGFGAAIILTLLGVDREIVMHDYLVSNESEELFVRQRERMIQTMKERGIAEPRLNEDIVRIMSGVKAEYLLGAFEEIDSHYGGIEGYLEEIGVTAAEEAHLKERLLAK